MSADRVVCSDRVSLTYTDKQIEWLNNKCRELHYVPAPDTILFAVATERLQELKECSDQVANQCQLQVNEEGDITHIVLPPPVFKDHTIAFVIPMITWDRTRFNVSPKKIYYGNCPGCFQAAPLGFRCQNEHDEHRVLFKATQLCFEIPPLTCLRIPDDTIIKGFPRQVYHKTQLCDPLQLSR